MKNKRLKSACLISAAVFMLFLVILLSYLVFSLYNLYNGKRQEVSPLERFTAEFDKIPLPEGAEQIGKRHASYHGWKEIDNFILPTFCRYRGSILVKSDQSVSELNKHYGNYIFPATEPDSEKISTYHSNPPDEVKIWVEKIDDLNQYIIYQHNTEKAMKSLAKRHGVDPVTVYDKNVYTATAVDSHYEWNFSSVDLWKSYFEMEY